MEANWETKLLAFIACLFGLVFAQPVLFPLLLVFFLYLLLNPIQERMVSLKIPPVLSSAILVLLLLCIIVTSITFLVDPAAEWIKKVPELLQTAEHKVIEKPLEKINKATEIAAKITDVSDNDSLKISFKSLANTVLSLTSGVITFILTILVLLFFTLTYLTGFIQKLEQFFYKKRELKDDSRLFIHIKNSLSDYFVTFACISVGFGCIMALVFWLFNLPNPLLFGVMVTMLTFIPYFGHFIGIVIIFLVSFISFDSWIYMLLPGVFYILLSGLEGQVVTPLLLGKRLDLNPLIIILSMFFWGLMWGISGIIISIPLLIIMKISLEHIPSLAKYASLFEK